MKILQQNRTAKTELLFENGHLRDQIASMERKHGNLLQALREDKPLACLVQNIVKGRQSGTFKGKDETLQWQCLEQLGQNSTRKPKGRRWSEAIKRYVAAAKIKGGRRNAMHVTNIFNMAESTYNKTLRENKLNLLEGVVLKNFQTAVLVTISG